MGDTSDFVPGRRAGGRIEARLGTIKKGRLATRRDLERVIAAAANRALERSEGLQTSEINPLRSNPKPQPYGRSRGSSTLPQRSARVSAEPSTNRRILVFCASSGSCDPRYHAAAERLGRLIARAGHTVVYGGGAVGSMGVLADGALAEGGRVIGIIPRFMRELEWAHGAITELRLVDDMQDRKREMLSVAEAIVTLPGGSGTFEELFEAITAKRLGLFKHPIVIVNQDGFYDPLFALLERSVDERFMHEAHLGIWRAVDRVEQVLPAIEATEEWPDDALAFATR